MSANFEPFDWKQQNVAQFKAWLRSNWYFSVIKQFFWLEEARLLSIMNALVSMIPQSVLHTPIASLLDACNSGCEPSAETVKMLYEALHWTRGLFSAKH